jgi:hypothetical protein
MNYAITNYSNSAPVSYTVPAVIKATWGEVIIGGEYELGVSAQAARKAFDAAVVALDIDAGAKAMLDCAAILKRSDSARAKHNVDEMAAAADKNVAMMVIFAKAQLSVIGMNADKSRKVKVDLLTTLDRYLSSLEDLF